MIGKPDKNGNRGVWIYDPAEKRKRYFGSRKLLRDAQELERQAYAEVHGTKPEWAPWTCDEYADRWLERHHGPGTRRPAPSTRQQNESALKGFRKVFGSRHLDSISRGEALDWSRDHQANAKAVSAMFNDAVDDGRVDSNPFANRRLPQKRGRRDIVPLTEGEVTTLASLAEAVWGDYGPVVAGWVSFLAWTGCRPGEAASRRWEDVDLEHGLVTVPRIKGDMQTDTVVLPPAAVQALERMPVQQARNASNSDLLFLTQLGKPYGIGSYAYYWGPVRAAFVAQSAPSRLKELQKVKGALDVYALRHFCGSLMADRGANEFEISAQLGNSPEVCRETYVHVYRDRVNERNAAFLSDNVRSLNDKRRNA